MATTTTNFGWDIPQSTDLVKDGATAIAALGQDIDTALVDLKGGTSGQVLAKNSNTDMDFIWVTDAAGDITGVTAGTGISGGGTSGTVTVTNSMATAIDAKGDLIAGTAADTFSRLAVGTNGQVLTADSAEATGLKWSSAATSSGPAFRVYRSGSNQSLTTSTDTKIQFNSETFDTANCFDSTTNYRFTPNVAGYYQVNSTITVNNISSRYIGTLYKNGSKDQEFFDTTGNAQRQITGSTITYLNGTTDYIEMFVYVTGTSPNVLVTDTVFSGAWIRS